MGLKQQLLVFATSLGAGFLFGVVYDLYRVINRRFRLAPWFTQAGDLIAWLTLGGAIFVMLQYISSGEFRGFVLVGLGLGVLLYRYCFRSRVARVLWKLVNAVARVLGSVWRGISWPFKIVFRLVDFLLVSRVRLVMGWMRKQFFPP